MKKQRNWATDAEWRFILAGTLSISFALFVLLAGIVHDSPLRTLGMYMLGFSIPLLTLHLWGRRHHANHTVQCFLRIPLNPFGPLSLALAFAASYTALFLVLAASNMTIAICFLIWSLTCWLWGGTVFNSLESADTHGDLALLCIVGGRFDAALAVLEEENECTPHDRLKRHVLTAIACQLAGRDSAASEVEIRDLCARGEQLLDSDNSITQLALWRIVANLSSEHKEYIGNLLHTVVHNPGCRSGGHTAHRTQTQ